MVVGVVIAREGCVVMSVLVMEVVGEDVVHAGVSGDATRRQVDEDEEGDTVEEVDVGNSGYPNLSWLLTPVKNGWTEAEERYNEAPGHTRRIIEKTFSLHLTGGSLYYSPNKVFQIIVACCMLHNLALRHQVPFLQEDEPEDGLVSVVELVDSEEEEADEEDLDNRTHIIQHAAVCTANGLLRLKDPCVDSWVVILWAYSCWHDGVGFAIASLSLTFGLMDLCGCLYCGSILCVGNNTRGGLPCGHGILAAFGSAGYGSTHPRCLQKGGILNGAEEEEPEDGSPEGFLSSVDDVTTATVPLAKPGSSVSDQGLTAEERREEREFQLQMARLNIESQQEERRAESEAKEAEAERSAKQIGAERAEAGAERALAEKKHLLAHELSLKELEIKVRQSEYSSDGGSIHAGPVGEKKVHVLKNVVPSYVVGDDIDKWLAAYEVALRAHGTSEEQWGVALGFYVPAVGRDTLPTVAPRDQNVYALMKAILLAKFGLTPEKFHQRFRDSNKLSTQTWVDCFDFSKKALNGWVWGSKVDVCKGLYDLILREHMISISFTECTST
ncbi:hypothetical protein NDU88_005066 [Pleurodeles waltl]|uniref:DDE Tnp4 domain-containing protein n=1 Tax=Pleurodeles waltl TaxID=8319 RepID=A0AAV7RL92_PLEWA|nr:hypothetical protein NDU88_005066 [Pleurodeles waltl]